MKTILPVLLILGFSTSAFAGYNGPLMTKVTHSGFTAPEWAFSTKCEIYYNKIIITKSNGATLNESVSMTQEVPIAMDGKPYSLINTASSGTIEQGPMLADAGQTTYTAFKILPNDAVERVDLLGKGSMNYTNKSPAARTLINFLDQVCK